MPGEDADKEGKKKYKVEFKQIYLSKPMVTEADGMTSTLFPKEARLRNLTYSAPLYIDMAKSTITTTDQICLLYTSPSPRDATLSRMPSSA